MKEPPDTNIQVVYHDSDTSTECVSATLSPRPRDERRDREREREKDARGHAFAVHSWHNPEKRTVRSRLTFLEAFLVAR